MNGAAAVPIVHIASGVRMRSVLEVAWAEWFDEHGITWAYEAERLRLGTIVYCPDFWLPDLRTVVEVKGIVDGKEEYKLAQVAPELAAVGELLMLAMAPAGEYFRLVWPTPGDEHAPFHLSRDIAAVSCVACGSWQFIATHESWACRVCGHDDGAGTHTQFLYPRGRR